MSSNVLKAERMSQMVFITSHSVVQQGVRMVFLSDSYILYLERKYVLPTCVLVDTVIDAFRCLLSAIPAPGSKSDLEI